MVQQAKDSLIDAALRFAMAEREGRLLSEDDALQRVARELLDAVASQETHDLPTVPELRPMGSLADEDEHLWAVAFGMKAGA